MDNTILKRHNLQNSITIIGYDNYNNCHYNFKIFDIENKKSILAEIEIVKFQKKK